VTLLHVVRVFMGPGGSGGNHVRPRGDGSVDVGGRIELLDTVRMAGSR
jgi:hypothetical protein